MATYKHGVYTSEQATSMTAPVTGTAGLQVVVGTAPVNIQLEKVLCLQYFSHIVCLLHFVQATMAFLNWV